MKLLTKAIEETIPSHESVQGKDLMDLPFYVKFFSPTAGWTWYVASGQRTEDGDYSFWGYVDGNFREWGYFNLSEMQELADLGRIERDRYYPRQLARNVVS